MYAIGKLNRSLLGRPTIEALGLVQRVNAVQTQLDIEKQFPKPFRGLGKMDEEYKIVLQGGARPYTLSTPCRITIPLLPKSRPSYIECMEHMGVMSRVLNGVREWLLFPRQMGGFESISFLRD